MTPAAVKRAVAAGDVELVFELADDLLEDVFGGDEADGGAELVDDDGDLAAALLELFRRSTASLVSGTTRTSRMTWRRVRPELRLPPRPRATARKCMRRETSLE